MRIVMVVMATLMGLHLVRKYLGGLTVVFNAESKQVAIFKTANRRFFGGGLFTIEDYHEQLEELWGLCDDTVQRKMLGIEDEDFDFGE